MSADCLSLVYIIHGSTVVINGFETATKTFETLEDVGGQRAKNNLSNTFNLFYEYFFHTPVHSHVQANQSMDADCLRHASCSSTRREGLRITYDQWRKALLSNKGVSILKGLQFGMLDSDDDGEVSLGDITRAIFRRANDRDLGRIRRFLEVNTCHIAARRRSSQKRDDSAVRITCTF